MSSAPAIHPTAIVDPTAELGRGVRVGPYAIVGPGVRLGARVRIWPHAVVEGHTTLAEAVEVFPQAIVGLPPQDLKYDGSPTRLEVGPRTVIREAATVQPGSSGEGAGLTKVGADCLIMAYCHVAHDCRIGDGVVMANATQIAGHCRIDDHVVLGGVTTVHQFVRIGRAVITGASSRVQQDIPPFMMADGHPARLVGLNRVGLRRLDTSTVALRALRTAYRRLFREGRYASALGEVEQDEALQTPEVQELCRFLRASQRGVLRARRRRGS